MADELLDEYVNKAIERFNKELKSNSWVSVHKADEFINTINRYAEQAVREGAVATKVDFYKMYVSKNYQYLDEFISKLKKPYLETRASSIVNSQDIQRAFEQYGTIGRGEAGNFTTSILEDTNLLFDTNGNIKSSNVIETVKGVDDGKYINGAFQYDYSPELVQFFDKIDEIRVVDGKTPGALLLNLPGAKTWAGENIALSQSELMMPTIDVGSLNIEEVYHNLQSFGTYTINNPTIILQDGAKTIAEGQFIIRKLGN
ncbi:nicotine adenine dinucleotide glycohydrolase [Streptococcus zhangguiae]|uniref:Nicotine adenine dinucleotide glycohydrolase n=1 Tax=Streptococcus zhangguiae TaxID=2664091 RepID=A0A6I4RHD3_9STRE|nr:nicotine adenine dinucleotide glycohydrolase [Streptococcus sp. zg-70]MWV55921.1 nicotine adenine dinucleotide glycohydrolase [Streptococcus sp. zg-70]